MSSRLANWLIFFALSLIWGSSFILMKGGLTGLSAYQVASLRILTSGIVLLPYSIRALRKISLKELPLIFISGALGSLLPAYLFCMAEEHIDSALAGVLNALTPVFTLIIAFVVFGSRTPVVKVIGIFIAFAGSFLLFLNQPHFNEHPNILPVLFVLIATLMYGTNVNLVSHYLSGYSSLDLASVALVLNAIPALVVLLAGNFFDLPMNESTWFSIGCSAILGAVGTAFATILFYKLIQKAGIIFSSMVTYVIPIIAIGWGLGFGEKIGWKQVACMVVILVGVYFVNYRSEKQDEISVQDAG